MTDSFLLFILLFIFAFSLPPSDLWFSSPLSSALAASFLPQMLAVKRQGRQKPEIKRRKKKSED
jgi:hypothetical protein